MSLHAAELEGMRQAAAREKASTDALLKGAANKIEDLERQLRQRIDRTVIPPEVPTPVGQSSTGTPEASKKRSLDAFQGSIVTPWTTSNPSEGYLTAHVHRSPLPPERAKELATLPPVQVVLGEGNTTPAIFDRWSLNKILGGATRRTVIRCTQSATALARSHNIQEYLCPSVSHNPWAPTAPGEHGYLQLGLGRNRDLFREGAYRHLFVGDKQGLVYCGWYHITRVEPLTKEEWATLPAQVRTIYAKATVREESLHEGNGPQNVLGMYDSGERRAPCVRLQCVKFDTAFYQELVRANDELHSKATQATGVSPPENGPSKRRRIEATGGKEAEGQSEEEADLALARYSASSGVPSSSPPGPMHQPVASSSAPSTTQGSPAEHPPLSIKLRIRCGFRTSQPDDDASGSSSISDDDDLYADE
ncbi:hypothetical protein OH77DRAFT_1443459 [Trametes cingulata]|nr:hypothetical protein OH77DRAFT_1443459 [Trametes cingulata]